MEVTEYVRNLNPSARPASTFFSKNIKNCLFKNIQLIVRCIDALCCGGYPDQTILDTADIYIL